MKAPAIHAEMEGGEEGGGTGPLAVSRRRAQFVTMNVYRAECVTELGSNSSEPERAKRSR